MELKAGALIAAQDFPEITQDQLRAYAKASGDPNPIHLDDEVAKKAGLPGVIAHGMLTAAFLAERAVRFGRQEIGGHWRLKQFKTRFKAMTFPGDVISIGGSVTSVTEDGNEVAIDLQARNQKGEVTTTASARWVRI
jgi:acyl dehydratase